MDWLKIQSSLSFFLKPLSFLYGLLLSWRRSSWESGPRNRLHPNCPCISVGNIAWGGTGKTPMTNWLLDWAKNNHHHAVVLSRGYKADVRLASIYVKPHHMSGEVGDEPLMLALEHPEADILVDPDRKRSGRYAMTCLNPEMIILDDGFQHLSVARDLDLVLLRPIDLTTEWNNVIPSGSWRENARALSRAHAFLFKATPNEMQNLLPHLQNRLAQFQRPVFSFILKPVRVEPLAAVTTSADVLWHQPYAMLAGVGNPALVHDTMTNFFGHPPDKELIYPDHHSYGFRDVERTLTKTGMPVVCTQKDAVKLRTFSPVNFWSLRIEVSFGPMLWTNISFPDWFSTWWEHRINERLEQIGNPWTGYVANINTIWTPPSSPVKQDQSAAETPTEDVEQETKKSEQTPESSETPDNSDQASPSAAEASTEDVEQETEESEQAPESSETPDNSDQASPEANDVENPAQTSETPENVPDPQASLR